MKLVLHTLMIFLGILLAAALVALGDPDEPSVLAPLLQAFMPAPR